MKRRVCRLANRDNTDVDLRDYEQLIIRLIDETVPGKNPKVYVDRFVTDELTHSEAVRLGRAMSREKELSKLGKEVTQYRLFEGRNLEYKDHNQEEPNTNRKGGHQ